MRIFQVIVFIVVSVLAGSLAAQPQPVIPSLSSEQVERLNQGEILVSTANDGDWGVGDTIAVIDAAPSRVMTVIDGLDAELIDIIGQEGGRDLLRGTTHTPWPMADREWTVSAGTAWRQVDGVRVLVSDWRYIPGSGNLENTEGYWLLIPWGEEGTQTLLRHYLIAGIGTPIPNFIVNWAMENQLPDTIEEIRETQSRLGVEEIRTYRDSTANE